jgi:hypothetical protein
MFNTSFLQIVVVLSFIFLMFGDFPKLLNNFKTFKTYFLKTKETQSTTQEKRESNP